MTKRSKASRFPAARIKKIMQMDEDVGKLASATPVMISKSLECFMQLLLDETAKEARSRGSKKLTAYHLKHTINNTPSFDFLLDIASRIPDPTHGDAAGPSESGAGPSSAAGPSRRKPSSAGAGGPSTPGTAAPKPRKRKSTATAQAAEPPAALAGEDRKPSMAAADEDLGSEYSGRHMVRPGIGNLLNPTEETPHFGVKAEAGNGGGDGGGTGEQGSGQVGSGEGGRGMFDDYEDDDDY